MSFRCDQPCGPLLTQVSLRRDGVEDVAWIEPRFAVVGRILQVRAGAAIGTEWTVTAVYATKHESEIGTDPCPGCWEAVP